MLRFLCNRKMMTAQVIISTTQEKKLSRDYKIILNVGDQMSDLFKNVPPHTFEICDSTYYILKVKDDPSNASLKFIDIRT